MHYTFVCDWILKFTLVHLIIYNYNFEYYLNAIFNIKLNIYYLYFHETNFSLCVYACLDIVFLITDRSISKYTNWIQSKTKSNLICLVFLWIAVCRYIVQLLNSRSFHPKLCLTTDNELKMQSRNVLCLHCAHWVIFTISSVHCRQIIEVKHNNKNTWTQILMCF